MKSKHDCTNDAEYMQDLQNPVERHRYLCRDSLGYYALFVVEGPEKPAQEEFFDLDGGTVWEVSPSEHVTVDALDLVEIRERLGDKIPELERGTAFEVFVDATLGDEIETDGEGGDEE